MSLLKQFAFRLRALFRKEKLDADMAEEMRLHLELRTERNIEAGMPKEEARYAAQRSFGCAEQIKENVRDARGWIWLEQAAQDFRYGYRALMRQRGFATVAILTLALGIGATSAIFSVVNAVILKPLPYDQPGQLVQAFEVSSPYTPEPVSPGVFLDWRKQSILFEGFAAFGTVDLNVTGSGEPERISGVLVSANGLELLRARPVLGRIFSAGEDQLGNENVVVLTHQLWQSHFGGAADVIGQTLSLNGRIFTVIGVLPSGFLPLDRAAGIRNPQFAIPYVFDPAWTNNRSAHFLRVVYARLKPGVTVEQGRAELGAIAQRSKSVFPAWKKDFTASLEPMAEQLAREIKPALIVLLGAVGLLLAIACANVANLLLARASSREKEIALRAALGASRGRIVRQLLTESILLSLLGGALGLALAFWATGTLRRLISEMNFPRAHEITLDVTVLGWTAAMALLTGIVFGLVPALRTAQPDLNHALNDAARSSTARGDRLRSGLIVCEMGLSLVLLVGAGLLLNSFFRLAHISPGFEPARALTMQLTLPELQYPNAAQRMALYSRVAAKVSSLPGVSSVGLSAFLPLGGRVPVNTFQVPGWAAAPPEFTADYDFCTPDFFRAMGIPLRRGRFFAEQELKTEHQVVIINEAMVRICFPHEEPLGRQIVFGRDTWEIVGVVGDVRSRSLSEPAQPTVYLPIGRWPIWRNATLVVRTEGEPVALAKTMRKTILDVDPLLPVANVRRLENVMAGTLADRRLMLVLLALFALAALTLSGIGLFGIVAYAVSQRTREFGIRTALGASQRHVLGLVLRRGLILAGIGLGGGIVSALGLTQLLGKFLFEITPTDPMTFIAVSLLLLGVALLASWLPARRAACIDPMVALRCE